MLTVALTSSFITIQSSRPTQAESLLYTVGCIVRGILTTNCPSNNTQPTPPSEQPQTSPPSNTGNTGGGSTPPSTNNNAPTTPSPQPIELDKELLTQLPKIPEMKSPSFASTADGLILPSVRGVSSTSVGVLGARDVSPIRATSEGWNIVGAPWYWWLIAIGGVLGLYYVLKSFINRSFLGIVK